MSKNLKDTKYKRIIAFDFDKTLVHTQEPEEGRKIWLKETGEIFPHDGWWGRPESLDLKIFYPAINGWTYKYYTQAIEEENSYVILATGRIEKLRKQVQDILDFHDFKFHDVFCSWGETYKFKTRLFEQIIRKNPDSTEFIMYDDRHEHLIKFIEWAKDMENKFKIKITIIDVLNKKQLY